MPSFLLPFIHPLSKKTDEDRPAGSCPQEILSYCVGWGWGWGWGVLADMVLDSTCFSWTFIVAFWRTERFRKNILLFSWISLFNITLKNVVSPLWIFLHNVIWCRLRGQKTRQTGPRVQGLPLEKIHTGYDPCVFKSNSAMSREILVGEVNHFKSNRVLATGFSFFSLGWGRLIPLVLASRSCTRLPWQELICLPWNLALSKASEQ